VLCFGQVFCAYIGFEKYPKLYVWGSGSAPNANESHYRPLMRMIIIYALAKRDQISGSGRPNFASGRIFRVQYTLNQGVEWCDERDFI
jgi:hypothetical protein